MKITKTELKKLIKESLNEIMKERRSLKEDLNNKPLYRVYREIMEEECAEYSDEMVSECKKYNPPKIEFESNNIEDLFKYIDNFFTSKSKPLTYHGMEGSYEEPSRYYPGHYEPSGYSIFGNAYIVDDDDVYDMYNEDDYDLDYKIPAGLISIKDLFYKHESIGRDPDDDDFYIEQGIDGFDITTDRICCLNEEDVKKISDYIKTKYPNYNFYNTKFVKDFEHINEYVKNDILSLALCQKDF